MKIKKLLAIILSVIMVITIIPTFSVLGEADLYEGYFRIGDFVFIDKEYYEDIAYGDRTDNESDGIKIDRENDIFDPNTLWITGYTGENTSIVIPESIDGKKITRIRGFHYLGEKNIEIEEISFESNIIFECYGKTIPKVNLPKNSTIEIVQVSADNLYIPADTRIANGSCLTGANEFTLGKNHKYYTLQSGVLFNKTKTKLIAYPSGKQEKRYTVPTGVTAIGESAFRHNKTLSSVTIPKSVTRIYKWAFSNTDIVNVNSYGNLEFVGESCFNLCRELESVVFNGKVNVIYKQAFRDCLNLTTVKFKKGYLKVIGKKAFYDCDGLKNITISNTKNLPKIYSNIFAVAETKNKIFYVKSNTFAKKLNAKLKKIGIKSPKIYIIKTVKYS